MRLDQLLRIAAMLLVGAAVADPGCLRRSEPRVRLVTSADADATLAADVAVAAQTAGLRMAADGEIADLLVASGSPVDVMAAHHTRAVDVAVRPRGEQPNVSAIVAPTRTAVGLATRVRVRPDTAGRRAVRVTLRDAVSGRVVARADTEDDPSTNSWVDLMVAPTAAGRWALCASATTAPESGVATGEAARNAPCDAMAVIDVAPGPIRVDILEARPAWSTRFSRLALESWGQADLHAETRLAPGIATRTRPPIARRTDPDLTIVAGLEALQPADVRRLREAVAVEGQTVLLLADEAWPRTVLRDLWPDGAGRLVTAAAPRTVRLGTGTWTVAQWLEPPPVHAGLDVVASLDATPPVPVVLARSLARGRVVAVLALDGWRRRADDQDAFDAAWQTLVLSLALDVWTPDLRTWRLKGPLHDEVHVVRSDTDSLVVVRAVPTRGDAPSDTPDVEVAWHSGGRHGVARITPDASTVIGLRPAVGNRGGSVIDVGPRLPMTSTWDDVSRVLAATGGVVAAEDVLPGVLTRHAAATRSREHRWWITRQWWYAATVLVVLGGEWWYRRRSRLP